MRRSRENARRNTSDDLQVLGRELTRLRRRCRWLRQRADQDWGSWSAANDETNTMARRINRVVPLTLSDLQGAL